MRIHSTLAWANHCLRLTVSSLVAWLVLAGLAAATAPAQDHPAQDQITVRNTRTGQTSQFPASVIAWNANQLVYRANDRQNTISSARVVRVTYPKSESQKLGDDQFQNRQYTQAFLSYENAMDENPRAWVREELLARQVQCASALDRQSDALVAFLKIRQSSAAIRHFHLIPLKWVSNRRAEARLVNQYQKWLSSGDEIQSLIAASWLLDDATNNQAAEQVLRRLARSDDSGVAHLAGAQLWRNRIVDAKTADLQRWQTSINRMPESLQPGPRYLYAISLRQLAEQGQASPPQDPVVRLLQIPILYPERFQLSASALQLAWRSLDSTNRKQEAAIILNELKRDYAFQETGSGKDIRLDQGN